MSRLTEEIEYFTRLFANLQSTNSRIMKLEYIRQMPEEYKESWEFILECLDGKHPFGYKYDSSIPPADLSVMFLNKTVKEVLLYLLNPMINHNLSQTNIYLFVQYTTTWGYFFEPIVNRTLRLGIRRSLLSIDQTAPMLAKKLDDKTLLKLNRLDKYYLTEKLDGNRCIAYNDGIEWHFVSRNGKEMHVSFDMSQFPINMIFDGEVLSKEQTKMSIKRTTGQGIVKENLSDEFSKTSGLINSHTLDKDLVYNIFDIIDEFSTYEERRNILNQFHNTNDIRILPILLTVDYGDLFNKSSSLLNYITDVGGEGIMINSGSSEYVHKRDPRLLKFKKVYSIDMKVVDIEYGTGKYEGEIGALKCIADDGDRHIECMVGTGLSDEQRFKWSIRSNEILGKIVEVGYFSLSQNSNTSKSNSYSLRFPRLIKVRSDKNDVNLEV